METLIGYTGFVGSNIASQYSFDMLCNSKNTEVAYGSNPELCVYSGIRSEMFIANSAPEADFAHINEAIKNIKSINAKKLVLISTIAVYEKTNDVNEDSDIDGGSLTAYGKNRLYLEDWVRNNVKDYHIIRLPALYGNGLKKNFINDIISITPALLTIDKFEELVGMDSKIEQYYNLDKDGFYKCKDPIAAKPLFENIGFTAVNFTDSRNIYQFYGLENIWRHIQLCIKKRINIINLVTEPLPVNEIYEALFNKEFVNHIRNVPFNYDVRTKHLKSGYFFSKQEVLSNVLRFIKSRKL